MSLGRSLSLHTRVYRTLLLAYPRAFRQVYGADMVQIFGDRLRELRERGERRTVGLWFRILLDLVKTAPVQRLEGSMSREAAFALMFVLLLVTAAVGATIGSAPVFGTALIVGIVTGVVLLATGAFRSDRARSTGPGGRPSWGQWWLIPAAVLALAEIALVAGQMVDDPKIENAVALAIVGGAGIAALTGIWLRGRSRNAGDWMIVFGVLPSAALFWWIVPPIAAGVVIVLAIVDSIRAPRASVSA